MKSPYLGNALSINTETFDLPVPGLDGIDTAVGNDIVELLHNRHNIKGIHTVCLFEGMVHRVLHLLIIQFEQIFKQQRQQITRHLNTLIAVIILSITILSNATYLIGKQGIIENTLEDLSCHISQINTFGPEVVLYDRHVAEDGGIKELSGLLFGRLLLAPLALSCHDQRANPLQRLRLCENAQLMAFFHTQVEVRSILGFVSDLVIRRLL